jgi:hypothetical protein
LHHAFESSGGFESCSSLVSVLRVYKFRDNSLGSLKILDVFRELEDKGVGVAREV